MTRTLVAGASRGIGAAIAADRAARGEDVITLARSPCPTGRWIKADLSDPAAIAALPAKIGDGPLDHLIFGGGTWENGAFTASYDFTHSPMSETLNVLAVNLAAPILLIQALLPMLRAAAPVSRVVWIGSTSGLENAASPEVANSASKYGLRGAAQALAKSLNGHGIGVSVVNPGNVATDEVLQDIASGAFPPQRAIPMADLLASVEFALSLSSDSVAREINLEQMTVV